MAKRISTPKIKALVAGNWKMNGTGKQLGEVRKLVTAVLIAKSRAPMS